MPKQNNGQNERYCGFSGFNVRKSCTEWGRAGNNCTKLCKCGWEKREVYGTAVLLSRKKLTDGDRIAGGTRRTFEAKRCKTEGEFVSLRCR